MGTSSNPSNSFSATSNPAISIVVPAYNEERRLPGTIKDLRSFFGRFGSVEIIIVIEKSSDRTVELATQAAAGDPNIHIVANDVQRGKGYAVKSGMLRAKGEIVFFMDADLSTPLAEVISFLSEFQVFFFWERKNEFENPIISEFHSSFISGRNHDDSILSEF